MLCTFDYFSSVENQDSSCTSNYNASAMSLSSLFSSVKEPLPEKLMAKDITDRAQQLIDNLNAKRKHDTRLIEEYRQAMEEHVSLLCNYYKNPKKRDRNTKANLRP